MPKFKSLDPSGLADDYDVSIHGREPIVEVTEDDESRSIRLDYVFPGFTVSDDTQEVDGEVKAFQEVGISGAGWLSESGHPLLPSFGRFVQIPPGCDYEVTVSHGAKKKFKRMLVTPAQEMAFDTGGEAPLEFDAGSYSSDEFYPSKLVEVTETHDLDDYRALLVHVRPLQYNAKRKILKGYSNISVEIALIPNSDSAPSVLTDPEANREGFGNLVLNPARSIERRFPGVLSEVVVGPLYRVAGPEFLIIYDHALEAAATRLALWKRQRGMLVETESIGTIGNTVASIKQCIRTRRGLPGSRLRYVLLLGDIANVVTEQLSGATTDHYFFTRDDAVSGTDCKLPWVAGGRIPVTALEDAMDVVDQIIRFEKKPPCDAEYYRRMTFAAYFQDDHPQDGKANRAYMKTMEGIRAHMSSIGFDVEPVYVSNNPSPQLYKDGSTIPAGVKASIVEGGVATDLMISETSEGQLVVGHRDHGGDDGWAHPAFHDTHLKGIHSSYPSIFYSINCLTGRFDANPYDSFAEAALKMEGGPPSLIAATEVSGTWRNDSMMKALFDAMWPGVIPTFPGSTASYPVRANRLGDILAYAKSYLLVAHGANTGVKNHFEIYHVIGDPTLELWDKVPGIVRLEASIKALELRVTLNRCPEGAVVTVWHGKELMKRIEPRFTSFTIPLKETMLEELSERHVARRGDLSVCFGAPGHRFVEVKLRLPSVG